MKGRYLEVTFRRGRALAGYLYLPRGAGAKSVRTEEVGPGLLVDFAESGEPIGLEITSPATITLEQINAVLTRLGVTATFAEELAPLRAA